MGKGGLPFSTSLASLHPLKNDHSMLLTKELIEKGKSTRGGWSQAQLSCLGVAMPLQSGWMNTLDGKEILDESYERFLSLKDAHVKVGDPSRAKPSKELIKTLEERARRAILTGGPIGSRTFTCKIDTCTYPNCLCE